LAPERGIEVEVGEAVPALKGGMEGTEKRGVPDDVVAGAGTEVEAEEKEEEVAAEVEGTGAFEDVEEDGFAAEESLLVLLRRSMYRTSARRARLSRREGAGVEVARASRDFEGLESAISTSSSSELVRSVRGLMLPLS
jgi:hypothetical protein